MSANMFTLYEQIGHGARGRVYRAHHNTHNKIVAVKYTPKNMATDMEVKMIQKVQSCRHSVKYYEHHLIDEHYAIVMEHVDGCDCRYLLDLVEHGIFLTEKELRDIARSVCEFLQDCHKQNIMYGDIKPANIMYIPPSKIKMVDVGCARPCTNVPFQTPLGTPIYFSPEKFRKNFGFESDIWSVGVMMYQFVCGQHPFAFRPEKYQDMDMLYQEIVSTELTFHHPQWNRVSPMMQHLIAKMLEKDQQKRISIEEVMNHSWWDAFM